jgi:hypothetical protein
MPFGGAPRSHSIAVFGPCPEHRAAPVAVRLGYEPGYRDEQDCAGDDPLSPGHCEATPGFALDAVVLAFSRSSPEHRTGPVAVRLAPVTE